MESNAAIIHGPSSSGLFLGTLRMTRLLTMLQVWDHAVMPGGEIYVRTDVHRRIHDTWARTLIPFCFGEAWHTRQEHIKAMYGVMHMILQVWFAGPRQMGKTQLAAEFVASVLCAFPHYFVVIGHEVRTGENLISRTRFFVKYLIERAVLTEMPVLNESKGNNKDTITLTWSTGNQISRAFRLTASPDAYVIFSACFYVCICFHSTA